MILSEAIRLLSIGLAIGLILTLAAGKAASTVLYGLTSHDPFTLAIGAITLAVWESWQACCPLSERQPWIP